MPHPDLLPLRPTDLTIGEPVPYALFDADRQLLLSAGQIIHDDQQLQTLVALGLFYDPNWQGVRVAGVATRANSIEAPAERPAKAVVGKRHFAQVKLAPGIKLHIQPSDDAQAPSASVKLIGWLEKTGVLMSGLNSQGQPLPFNEGQALKAKTIAGKNIISFECTVEKICSEPFPYLHLSWPETIQIRQLRSSLRVDTQLIASVSGDGIHSIPARISNLSADGAMLEGSELALETDQEISMALRLNAAGIDHTMSIKAFVRNQKSEPAVASVQYGLEFFPLSTTDRLMLEHYIFSSALE